MDWLWSLVVEVDSEVKGDADGGLSKEKLRLMLLAVDGLLVDLGLLDAEEVASGNIVLYGG